MRGLVRFFAVGFTVVSLMLVAVVGVSATSTSGKSESTKVFNSVASLLSGQVDKSGPTSTAKDKEKDKDDKDCRERENDEHEHEHGTPGHEHHPCKEDESRAHEEKSE